MSKLQKFNNVLFTLIGIPALILLVLAAIDILSDTFGSKNYGYDVVNGSISAETAKKNADKGFQSQYISYEPPFILSATNGEYVIPAVARNIEKPEKRVNRYGFFESSVNEVVFDSDEAAVATAVEETNENAKKPRVKYSESSIYNSGYYFFNLLYNNDEKKIEKSLFDTRFSGWHLTYIRVKNRHFLTFLGTEKDSNNDGLLNDEDICSLYIYDLDQNTMKTVDIPDLKIEGFFLPDNSSYIFLQVKDPNRPKAYKQEVFFYRYDMLTGELRDAVPAKEKAIHEKLIK